jgi:serine/threonine protein kinase
MTEETIFAAALGKSNAAERSAYLDEACGGDAGLRRRVEALLASHDKVGNFLERPAVEQLAAAPVRPEDVAGTRTEQPGDGGESDLAFLQPSTKPGSLGRLAHYEVLEVLGQGGCGTVLKAFDEKLHRLVAIKVMAPHLAATSPPRKRFLREARAAAAIRHENVVGIYAVEDQPIPYLVMEYIAGETLQQKLDRMGPLDAAEVLRIGRQIANGLAAAHALGLIHRDIKPSNILLENGVETRVKITDFGLARAADDASLSQSGLIAGTPLYMAPEQAQGQAIDQRSDLFSLGSVLYVMCSGRPPFRASTTLAVLKRVAEDTPRPIREIIPEVPRWLCAIVARLHAKKPEDRFASAKEVADLLARHLAKLQQDRGQHPLANGGQDSNPAESTDGLAPSPPKAQPAVPEPVQGASPKAESRPGPAPVVSPLRPRRRRWVAAAAVVFLLLAGLGLSEATGVTGVWGTVIRLISPEGTLVVEVDDPDVTVTIDGRDLIITGAGVNEIRLKAGEHRIQASKDGKLVRQELFTVQRNGRQVVRVSTEAGPAAASGKAEKPGAAAPPGPAAARPLDLLYIPADASAAVVVHPRRIAQSPVVAAVLPPGAADEMVKELGVKPEQIEQAVVFLQAETPKGPTTAPPKDGPGPGGPPDWTPSPGAIIRFAEPTDGKQLLTRLLKGLREENHAGKTYYRSSTGEALLGLPLAGALPDEWTVLLAPEPVLRTMLTADSEAKSPLLDRLRKTDDTNEITGIVMVEPYRNLLNGLIGPFREMLPANLADAAKLPDRLVSVTAAVNLRDKTLATVSLEANSEESVEALDDLAFKALNWARKTYPDFRPTLIGKLPADVVQPALAIADQVFGGIQVTREGKRLVLRLEKPEGLTTPADPDLIASSGFNDARGMNSDPTPGSPFALDSEGKKGGAGEPGWAGPWSTPSSPQVSFQKKVVHEGDGALYLSKGSTDRRLAEALGGQFQVEMFVQVPAGGGFLCYLKNGAAPWAGDGPVWNVGDGKFGVLGDDEKLRATGFVAEPGKWHKVTLRVDVPRNEWQFFVDDQKFETPRPLHFRRDQASLDTIWFQCETQAGIYIDALRITRQGVVTPPPKDLIASSGFNDARGMNSNPVPGSPFPLDTPNREGGLGEPGWEGPWLAHPDAVFQSKVTFEGDGALFLNGRPNFGPNYGRQLAQPQTGRFQVEYHVQARADTGYSLQFWKDRASGPFVAGPICGVQYGKFHVNEVPDTGIKCEPGRWYKVTMRIDVPKQTWELFVDDKRFDSPKPLKFRAKVEYLAFIDFIVGGGPVYIDALRVTRWPDAEKKKAEGVKGPDVNPAPVPGSSGIEEKKVQGEVKRPDVGPRAPVAPGPLDLKYIPADASAAVVVHPRRILQSPLATSLPPGAVEEMVRELGVKPEQVEQVIVLLQAGGSGPAAAPPPKDAPDLTPVPGAIIRFAEPADGRQVLTRLLKGLREEKHEGKTYYRTSTGEALLGLPLAGALPDERTVLVAPEPVLRKMLAADGSAKSPLLDRLRQTDTKDEITGIAIVEPYRKLLNALAGQFKALLPPDLADAASLPDRVVAATAAVNLRDKTLFKVSLEADSDENAEALDDLAFKALNWARKAYPDFRPTLVHQLPAEVVQPALAVADQLFGGVHVTREGKRLVVRLEKPEGLGTPPEKDLIASSGFNDSRGMNSNPVPGSPFPLDTPNREGGLGEPGWVGPWIAHRDAVFQSKVVFEGDGALSLTGHPNFGPNYMRQLAQAQTGRFQVEFYLQVPAGSGIGGYLWQDLHGGADHSGPNWGAGGGKFSVQGYPDTGFKILPDRWYKVTFRIDVPKQTWEFFLDDKRFESPQPLQFRAKVQYLDVINFLAGEGVTYVDALRVTRLPPGDR